MKNRIRPAAIAISVALLAVSLFLFQSCLTCCTTEIHPAHREAAQDAKTCFDDIWSDSFETDKGWTGYGGTAGWERGRPYEGAKTGSGALATVLNGSYPDPIDTTGWITSPRINCSGYTHVFL